jgi:hypothetical protein
MLSGTASDGTLGLEAIKAEGGLTFAQDESARYDSYAAQRRGGGLCRFRAPAGTDRTGRGNKEIAAQIGISVKTIEYHKAQPMKKLDLRSRADIIRYGVQQGWLQEL